MRTVCSEVFNTIVTLVVVVIQIMVVEMVINGNKNKTSFPCFSFLSFEYLFLLCSIRHHLFCCRHVNCRSLQESSSIDN